MLFWFQKQTKLLSSFLARFTLIILSNIFENFALNTKNAWKSILDQSISYLEKLSYENIPSFGVFDYALS